jgi:hypothetical protein
MQYYLDLTANQILDLNKSIIRDLQQALDEGKASPYDRTADGFTLLSVSPINQRARSRVANPNRWLFIPALKKHEDGTL